MGNHFLKHRRPRKASRASVSSLAARHLCDRSAVDTLQFRGHTSQLQPGYRQRIHGSVGWLSAIPQDVSKTNVGWSCCRFLWRLKTRWYARLVRCVCTAMYKNDRQTLGSDINNPMKDSRLVSKTMNTIILTLSILCVSIGKFQQKREAFGAAKQRSSEYIVELLQIFNDWR